MLTSHGPQAQWVPVGVPYVPNGMMGPGMMAPGMVFGPAYGYPSPGPMSGMPTNDGLRGYATFGGMPGMQTADDASAALAERLNELQLGARGRGPSMQQHTQGAFSRGGMAGPSSMQGASGQNQYYYNTGPPMQQQQQQHQQHQMQQQLQMQQMQQQPQHGGRGRQGRGGGRGGMPQHQSGGRGPGQQQQQKKKRPQKGLEDNIKRTVYISYVDCSLTEENLAAFFSDCGRIADCRICGDPNSAMRFAFIEFLDTDCAHKALEKTGSVLGSSPLRVLPSKTAIMPVNQELMPRSADEVERCSRTVYAANIDKKVDKNDVKAFFESLCGKVSRIRLLGDYAHSTRIAFVEFHHAEGALAALNCSGALLGSLPIRVSPSKTPVKVEGSKDSDDQSSSAHSVQSMPTGRPMMPQSPTPAQQQAQHSQSEEMTQAMAVAVAAQQGLAAAPEEEEEAQEEALVQELAAE